MRSKQFSFECRIGYLGTKLSTELDFARLLVQAEEVEASTPSMMEWLRFFRL